MDKKTPVLDLEARNTIYWIISKHPGLHFRELQRRTGLVIGSLQYHLNYMKKKGLITEQKSWDYSRFYIKGELSEEERKLMSSLRQKNIRILVTFLYNCKGCQHKDIAKNVGLSPSTVSWYLNRLCEVGIVKNAKDGRETRFELTNPELLVRVLIKYRESFLDKLVDKFIEDWV